MQVEWFIEIILYSSCQVNFGYGWVVTVQTFLWMLTVLCPILCWWYHTLTMWRFKFWGDQSMTDGALSCVFLSSRKKQRFCRFLGESSSREDFMVWSRRWSCFMTTFLHISGCQRGSLSSCWQSWEHISGSGQIISESWLTWNTPMRSDWIGESQKYF